MLQVLVATVVAIMVMVSIDIFVSSSLRTFGNIQDVKHRHGASAISLTWEYHARTERKILAADEKSAYLAGINKEI